MERTTFRAKYGKANEVVEVIKSFEPIGKKYGFALGKIYTDLSGRFDTVVWESEFEDLNQMEEGMQRAFKDPEFSSWFQRLQPLIEYGSRDIYRVEYS
jgi:hypothetical protein